MEREDDGLDLCDNPICPFCEEPLDGDENGVPYGGERLHTICHEQLGLELTEAH